MKISDFTSSSRLPTITSIQSNTNRLDALISFHPGDEDTSVGPDRTSTVHGCLTRQEDCGNLQPNDSVQVAESEKDIHSRAHMF